MNAGFSNAGVSNEILPQEHPAARGAIDLDEIPQPEILNTSRTQWDHLPPKFSVCSQHHHMRAA
jgi:hypothetical protein